MAAKAKVIPIYQQQQQSSNEAEQSVIGSILLDSGLALGPVTDLLAPEDFQQPGNQEIFRTCLKLLEKGNPVDLSTVASALHQAGKLAIAGGVQYLASLTDNVGTARNCEYWAQLVHDASIKRRLITKLKEIIAAANKPIADMAEFVGRVEERIFEISRSHNGKAVQPLSEAINGEMSRIEDIYNRKTSSNILPTGFLDLDRLIHGLTPAESIILAGRPGMGKTALGLNIAINVAQKEQTVAFFSLEMSRGQLSRRLLSLKSQIDGYKINGGYLSESDWFNLAEANADLLELPIFVDDTPQLTIHDIRGRSRRLKAKGQLDLVIIDYLQFMGTTKAKSREQEVAAISSGIKAMAKELNVPVLTLAQLNRKVEERSVKRPTMADLRESGAIEQDADVIFFLWKQHQDDPTINLIVEKNRNGRTGEVKMVFQKSISKFDNYVE